MKKLFCIVLLLHLISCGDIHLGMKYQKSILQGELNDSLYCYRLAWGRDAESFVISTTSDVCQGFDSSRDICFGRGTADIYYKVIADTLQIFSNISPKYPPKFKFRVVLQLISHDDYPRLDQEVGEGKLQEVTFGYDVVEVPCRALPGKSPYLIEFK